MTGSDIRARQVRAARAPAGPAFLLLALLVLAGGAPPAPLSAQQRVVRILASQTTAAVPFLVLGESQVPGLRIETELFINHAQALVKLLRGEADFLFTGTSQGWENYLDGGPVAMINTGIWGISSMIGRDEKIRSFADLKGKRVALPFPGAPLDFQTRYLLKLSRLDPDRDLQISYSAPPQAVARLVQGQLDAAPLPEPLAATLVREQGLKRLFEYTQVWAGIHGGDGRSPQVSLFATREYCRSEPVLVARLVEAWRAASQVAADNPDVYAHRFAAALATPEGVLEEAIRHTVYWVPAAEENRRRVLEYYREVQEFLPGSPPPLGEDFFCLSGS